MSFSTIYSSINKNLTQFLDTEGLIKVPRTSEFLDKNEYYYVEKPLHNYFINYSPSSIIEAIFPLKKDIISKFETFLVNIGCLFCAGHNNIQKLDNYHKTANTISLMFGTNFNGREVIGINFNKTTLSIRIDKDNIKIKGSGISGIETEHSLSNDFDTDFIVALNAIESQIYDLTGFVVNHDFSNEIKTLSIGNVVNKALANRYINDVQYVDKNDFLALVKSSGRSDSFDVSTNSVIFFQDDPKLLLTSLNHIFTDQSFNTLSKIITVVTNHKTEQGKVEDVDVIFPVDDMCYNNTKEPFVKIILSERYTITFSTDSVRLYINDVLYQVREYKCFSEILDTILEETSRNVSLDVLQKTLI